MFMFSSTMEKTVVQMYLNKYELEQFCLFNKSVEVEDS
jgi:hypothetical protein